MLTSREKDGAVHIPFTLRSGEINLKMIWAGRPVEAMLDTGSEFTEWPQSLQSCWGEDRHTARRQDGREHQYSGGMDSAVINKGW